VDGAGPGGGALRSGRAGGSLERVPARGARAPAAGPTPVRRSRGVAPPRDRARPVLSQIPGLAGGSAARRGGPRGGGQAPPRRGRAVRSGTARHREPRGPPRRPLQGDPGRGDADSPPLAGGDPVAAFDQITLSSTRRLPSITRANESGVRSRLR